MSIFFSHLVGESLNSRARHARRAARSVALGAVASMLAIGAFSTTEAAAESSASAAVDLNRATAEELAELPGIGDAKAAAIVSHRKASGAFRSVEDLERVRGIGPALVTKLRPLVTFGAGRPKGTSPQTGAAGGGRSVSPPSKK